MPGIKELLILFTAIIMGAVGQLSIKFGLNRLRFAAGGELPLRKSAVKVFTNFNVLFGLGIYVASTVLWLYILSKVDLSFAYPCISISYIIIIISGKFVFGEKIDAWKIAAIVLIIAGVVCLGLSELDSLNLPAIELSSNPSWEVMSA